MLRSENDIRAERHALITRSNLVEQLGEPMAPRRFSRALHKIKAAGDLSGADRVIIYSDGTITDEQDEPLGNLHDED